MLQIKHNLELVRERIARAAVASGRSPEEITLVAVTKTFPAEAILEGIEAGITDIGENRVQEAAEKHARIGPKARWHLIGHLQSNKAKKAVELFSLIHSIDSADLAREVAKRAQAIGKVQDTLVEVNTSGEEQKFGVSPQDAIKILQELDAIDGIKVLGLMTVGPMTDDTEKVRGAFRTLRLLFDQAGMMRFATVEMRHLSMGMSGDFELAIAQGATMVRIGSAIFGSRT